jgi:sulfur carrier protein ThiS
VEIKIQLYSVLRDKLPPEAKGKTVLKLESGATIGAILKNLGISRKVVISLNGEQITDYMHQLDDGDDIKIFSSTSGG